ncbi:hypothetical protein GCM10009823_01620 [Brevibacterium salitolerans]|uniref:Uncharacterized protein n=1 Tax=Brevibacterium salitolerans TaxID=1403566 RepID=A0ABN2WAU6_9MICO
MSGSRRFLSPREPRRVSGAAWAPVGPVPAYPGAGAGWGTPSGPEPGGGPEAAPGLKSAGGTGPDPGGGEPGGGCCGIGGN